MNQNGGAAKKVCKTMCSVQKECLQWALDKGEPYGIWGGASEHERRRMRRARRKA